MTRRISINTAILTRGISGIPRVTRYLIDAVAEMPGTSVEAVKPSWRRSRSSVVNAAKDTWWDFAGAERAARGADLLVSPCNLGGARRIAHVLCVHDVMPLEHPDLFDPKFALYYRTMLPLALRSATRVVTFSHRVRGKLLDMCGSADVHVIPLPGGREAKRQATFPPSSKRILVVGATEPHKNQVVAISAAAQLRKLDPSVTVVLVGPRGHAETAVLEAMRRFDPAGAWTSRRCGITDDELSELYSSAWLLMQPSINEGYGLPLVEAAEHGLPAIHSGAGAMTEVAPAGAVGSTQCDAFVEAGARLLDVQTWAQHAAGAKDLAGARSWPHFRTGLSDVIEPLLPRA
jgi:glycosyltransferase involved in cell wall biosynthesis